MPHPRKSGFFVTFEGGEGCGKSTQLQLLRRFLESKGHHVTATRDPGGCARSALLRKLLVEQDSGNWDALTEALLFMAARNELLQNVIRPALDNGDWVLSDRFVDSNMVYQACGRGVSAEAMALLADLVVADTLPDLTIVLDMPVEDGLGRALAREGSAHESRFEQLDVSFHERVRQGFLDIAAHNTHRCVVVDGRGSPEDVHARILSALERHLADKR
ncbi:MAG: dTMP kinase [Proteobacteria bacterium]|nr:dTMP kinase [Pseudomonadota bacterium]